MSTSALGLGSGTLKKYFIYYLLRFNLKEKLLKNNLNSIKPP